MKHDKRLEEEVFRFSHHDRARMALKLIESLEPGKDEEVDALWLDEAERRLAAHDEGGIAALDADDALTEAERRLK